MVMKINETGRLENSFSIDVTHTSGKGMALTALMKTFRYGNPVLDFGSQMFQPYSLGVPRRFIVMDSNGMG